MIRLVLVLGILLGSSVAHAHPLDIGYLRIESSERTLTVVFDLEASVAAKLIGTTPDAVASRATELADASYRLAPITTNAGTCTWTTTRVELRTATKTLSQIGTAECPDGSTTLSWELPVVGKLASTFELLVKSYAFSHEHVTILTAANARLSLSGDSMKYGFADLVWSGVEHIGAAPGEWHDADGWKLADGLDHVLFLLALLLAGGTLGQLLGIATGFTIGHSVTLGLATLGVVRVSPSIIEPLIALTIAAAAIEAIAGKFDRHRWKIATAFGFIHGFAFASALGELELASSSVAAALFGFNLGVEVGQIAVILVVAPLIIAMHRYRPKVGRQVVRVAGVLIFLAGMYWFIDRAFM